MYNTSASIFEIDSTDLQLQVKSAQNSVDSAQVSVSSAQNSVSSAQAGLNSAQASYEMNTGSAIDKQISSQKANIEKERKIGRKLTKNELITNLPENACVEVPCLVDGMGIHPCHVGELPVQCAAMNMTNINVQLLTIEAAHTKKREHIYQAAMLDPHTAAELSIDDIIAMCDELIKAHEMVANLVGRI